MIRFRKTNLEYDTMDSYNNNERVAREMNINFLLLR